MRRRDGQCHAHDNRFKLPVLMQSQLHRAWSANLSPSKHPKKEIETREKTHDIWKCRQQKGQAKMIAADQMQNSCKHVDGQCKLWGVLVSEVQVKRVWRMCKAREKPGGIGTNNVCSCSAWSKLIYAHTLAGSWWWTEWYEFCSQEALLYLLEHCHARQWIDWHRPQTQRLWMFCRTETTKSVNVCLHMYWEHHIHQLLLLQLDKTSSNMLWKLQTLMANLLHDVTDS